MASGRREFIKRSIYGIFTLLGTGLAISGIGTYLPVRDRDVNLVYFPLLPEDDVPRAGVRKMELAFSADGKERKTRVFLIASSTGPVVLSAVCSHLGCLVQYHKEKRAFICPCHGGEYDLSGRNVAGPPPAPLASFPVRVQDGMLLVGVRVRA